MSDCARAEEWIVDYLEGSLAPEPLAWMEAHLAACRECDGAVRSYREIREAYGGIPSWDVSTDVVERLRASARDEPAGARPLSSLARRPVAVLVAVAASALLVLGLWGILGAVGGPGEGEPDGRKTVSSLVREGDALRALGDREAAVAKYEEALGLGASRAESAAIHHGLGALHLELLEYGRALDRLEVVARDHLEYVQRDQVLLQKGEALVGLGRVEEALVTYRLYSREYPADERGVDEHLRELRAARELSDGVQDQLQALGYTSDG